MTLMKKVILTIQVCIIGLSAIYAHTYSGMWSHVGNVYYSGTSEGETQYKNQAIAFLCNQYIQQYHPKYEGKVYLEIAFVDNIIDARLSYDLYEGERWQNAENNRPVKGKGIRIQLSQSQDRAESVLKLLEYGLNNYTQLKREKTIDKTIVIDVLRSPASLNIRSTLQRKVFRNLGVEAYNVNREYYFQNEKYFFIDFFNRDSVYLVLNDVKQIISDYYMGSLIFETDSTGYYYNRETKKLSKKFTISNKLESFYYTHTSTDFCKKRIYFEYESYEPQKTIKKFIYLANEFFLVQRVEEYEDIWIEQALRQ